MAGESAGFVISLICIPLYKSLHHYCNRLLPPAYNEGRQEIKGWPEMLENKGTNRVIPAGDSCLVSHLRSHVYA